MAASRFFSLISFLGTAFLASVLIPASHAAWLRSGVPSNEEAGQALTESVVGHWTRTRRSGAIPRDIYVDSKGLAYISNGTGWAPYGHTQGWEEASAIQVPLSAEDDADNLVTRREWTFGGRIQTAVGRIFFEMPRKKNPGWREWDGYVCSGTVVRDSGSDRTLILTAAHCVYDEAHQEFARNVLFIPNQAAGTRTDTDCSNDIIGCWTPLFGVVDFGWAGTLWPRNLQWDYAFYVVPVSRAHRSGRQEAPASLEEAAGSLPITWETPDMGSLTHGIGYSYVDDPKLMYCAMPVSPKYKKTNWWLPGCGLSGGASGGPWIQPLSESDGSGPIISVNSWGFINGPPGMGGSQLASGFSTAKKLFQYAQKLPFTSIHYLNGQRGSIRS